MKNCIFILNSIVNFNDIFNDGKYILLNSMVIVHCPVLDRKYNFWVNLVQKIKMVYFLP